MGKFILRVRLQRLGEQEITSLWLLENHGDARSGLMFGDVRPETAEQVVELLKGRGVKVERDPPQQWHAESEPTVEERVAATEAIEQTRGVAATEPQGELFA